jgi:hypothetical protein
MLIIFQLLMLLVKITPGWYNSFQYKRTVPVEEILFIMIYMIYDSQNL